MNFGPLSYLDSAGPAARPLTQLAWGLGGLSIAVIVVVGVALAGAIWRRRPVADGKQSDEVWRPGNGLAWIYVGLGITVPILAACTVWILVVLGHVIHPTRPAMMTIQVTAHQWWWEVRYLGDTGRPTFTTANEIHIPADQPIRIELRSHDVIHSFWVPKLSGKMDVIPGITNVTWLQAATPGRYSGQCGEFCGLEHAKMAFYVVADSPSDFAAWRAQQTTAPVSLETSAGGKVFAARCASCHTISGTPAGGIVGPDLSHLASRSTLAAGLIPNDRAHLLNWIKDPQAIKPEVFMPAVPLTVAQRGDVASYLQTLN
jgi:cytochrome c oxidase subunit 2